MGPSSSSLGYMRTYPDHIEDHDRHPDRDRRIRDIERPEMVRSPVDVDEIDDRPGDDTVEQIARSATDDESEADAHQQLIVSQAGSVPAYGDERRNADDGDHDRLETKLGGVQ